MDKYVDVVATNAGTNKASWRNGMKLGHAPLSLIIFKKYDADEDGSLNLDEFQTFTKDKGYFFSKAEVQTAFS